MEIGPRTVQDTAQTHEPDAAVLVRRLERERLARKEARALFETISRDLWDANLELHGSLEQLAERCTALERSNADLEQFALLASHDLQEPLRAIKGCGAYLSSALAGSLDAEHASCLRHIERSSSRLQELVAGLMRYSKATYRKPAPVAVDTGGLVRTVCEDLILPIEESNAEMVLGDLPTVLGDPRQLRHLFQNLISNAVKYAGDSPPHVAVGAITDDSEHVFSVKDRGIGIAPEHADRIFEVFARLDDSVGEGSGIGLTICRKVVENHGGRIWVESQPGQGCAFFFTLPAG